MIHTPKNTTKGHTEAYRRERDRLMRFYQETPWYGTEHAEALFNKVKTVIPALIQASVCGMIISLTTYKQDADRAAHLLAASFKKQIRRKECPYTGYITLSLYTR